MLKVRYSRAYSLFFIGLGIVELWIMLTTKQWVLGALCVVTVIFGIRASTQVYISAEQNDIVLHALIGPLQRHYPYESPRDVSVMDGRILIDSNGKRRQISLPIWMLNRDDLSALQERFR